MRMAHRAKRIVFLRHALCALRMKQDVNENTGIIGLNKFSTVLSKRVGEMVFMNDELRLIPNWKPGDTRVISDKELDNLYLSDHFDSYSQVYEIDGMKWKVTNRINKKDGSADIMLVCVE